MRPRILVVEGPDGGGKTTLCRRVQEERGFGYRHEGPPPPDVEPVQYYRARLFDAVLESLATKGVVLDRFALGDRVYGPILRGADRFGTAGWLAFDAALQAVNAVQVVCLPPYEVCRDSWLARRGQEYLKDEETFCRTYSRWTWAATLPHQFLYDWTAGEDLSWRLLDRRMEVER